MSYRREPSSMEVHETYCTPCVCLAWHPNDLLGGGRSGYLRIAAEVDNVGPLPKVGSWTDEQEMVKNPEVVEVSSQETVDVAPEIESKLRVNNSRYCNFFLKIFRMLSFFVQKINA